jgi:hypothetical protein
LKHRILYNSSFLEIEYDILEDLIKAKWKGSQAEDSIKSGYRQILKEISGHVCNSLLDDHSDISGLWTGAAEWVANEWFPNARKSGLRFMACIYSSNIFSKRSTQRALDLINSSVALGFDFPEAAEKWICEIKRRT